MERNIALPEMILWTATRIAMGVGIGMLLSRNLSRDARKATGIALTIVGGFTTIPLVMGMRARKNLPPEIKAAA